MRTQLELSEDLYSMAFVSFLLPEYIYFHKNVKDNENGADDTDVDKAEQNSEDKSQKEGGEEEEDEEMDKHLE